MTPGQILTRRSSLWRRQKYTVLLVAGVFSAIYGLFIVLFEENSNHIVVRLVSYACTAILVLASDEASYITGVTLPVAGGDLG